MNYEKYRKYKNKYLDLKNKIGGSDPDLERAIKESLEDLNEGDVEVGSKLYVIPNSGMIEGMSQQCFWISIFNYLQKNPSVNIPDVSNVRELRTFVGLRKDTEHLPFDENDNRFRTALNYLTDTLDLTIIVHFVNASGYQIILRDAITRIPEEAKRPINAGKKNTVHITQHGLYHFQYMVEPGVGIGAGDNGVLVGDTLYKDKKMENMTNNETMIRALTERKVKMSKEFSMEGISPSDLPAYIFSYNDEKKKINKEINKYEKKNTKINKNETMIKMHEEEIKKLNELKIKMNKEFSIEGVSPSKLEAHFILYNNEIERINRQINKKEQQIIKKKIEKNNDEYLKLIEKTKNKK